MGSEQGRDHGSRPILGSLADGCERFQLRLNRESVTRFGLDCSCALGSDVAQNSENLLNQGRFRGVAHTLETRADSAPSGRDLLVSGPFKPFLEINETRKRKHRMRVG